MHGAPFHYASPPSSPSPPRESEKLASIFLFRVDAIKLVVCVNATKKGWKGVGKGDPRARRSGRSNNEGVPGSLSTANKNQIILLTILDGPAWLGDITRDNLVKRQRVDDFTYVFCNEIETCQHLFFDCVVASNMWLVSRGC
jgi:hypothetical protein